VLVALLVSVGVRTAEAGGILAANYALALGGYLLVLALSSAGR